MPQILKVEVFNIKDAFRKYLIHEGITHIDDHKTNWEAFWKWLGPVSKVVDE